MQPYQFDYHSPQSLEEAVSLLEKSGGEAQVISGGQSLVAAMNLRLARPSALVDLRRIAGLDRIELRQSVLCIGARATHAQIIENPVVGAHLPVLREAGMHIAHATIREWGTMAGSLALADPAAEWPTVLTAVGGTVVAFGPSGQRRIPVSEFFVSLYTTALPRNEIITEIHIPLPAPSTRLGFYEFARQSGAFALGVAAAAVDLDHSGVARKAVVVLGGCGPKPLKHELTQLHGKRINAVAIQAAVDAIALSPSADIHASAESRASVARTVMVRAISRAIETQSKG